MIVEMTTGEQQQYLRHDNSGSRLTPLTPLMPNGNPRSIKIVEGGCCSDTRYEEKLQEKGAPHKALEEALNDYNFALCLSSQDNLGHSIPLHLSLQQRLIQSMDLQAKLFPSYISKYFDIQESTHTNQPRKKYYFEPGVMKINSLGAPRGVPARSVN